MGLAKKEVVFLMMMVIMACTFGLSMATLYEVGDYENGWGWEWNDINYQQWADAKSFFVGDVIFFHFDNQTNDAMQVNVTDFKSCNADSPIAIYASGSVSITLNSSGDYYYIGSFPGHCQGGQKVHISVNSPAPPPAAAAAPPPAPVPALPPISNNYNNFPHSPSISFKLSYHPAMAAVVFTTLPSFLNLLI